MVYQLITPLKWIAFIAVLLPGWVTLNAQKEIANPNTFFPFGCTSTIRTQPGSTINVWDWRVEDYDMYLAGNSGVVSIPSPWFANGFDQSYNMEFLASGNPSNYDFQPADGWELVYRNFGEPGESILTPSYALYNRNTGIVRVFFYVQNPDSDYNTLYLHASHQNTPAVDGGSAIFNYAQADPIMPLTDFSVSQNNTGFTGFNRAPALAVSSGGAGGYWALLQFPTYYDPCVCTSGSQMLFKTILTEITDVLLEIEGTSTSEAIYSSSGSPGINPFRAISNVAGDLQKGYKVYKDLDGFYDDIDSSKTLSFLSAGLSWMPYAGGVATFLDLIIGGGKSSTPTLLGYNTEFDLNAVGTLETSFESYEAVVNTPGSDQSNLDPDHNPTYNNPLGTFALLNKPRVDLARSLDVEEKQQYTVTTETKRFKLDASTIRYAINPVADFTFGPGDLQAGLIFEVVYNHSQSSHPTLTPANSNLSASANAYWVTPMVNIECLEDYTVDVTFEDTDHEIYGGFYDGMEVGNVEIMIAFAPEVAGSDNIDPVIVGRYPVDLQSVSNSTHTVLPENPFVGMSPAEINSSCNKAFITPVSTLSLGLFCRRADRYDPTFKGPLGLNSGVLDLIEEAILREEEEKVDSDQKAISVYPNPVKDNLVVEIDEQINVVQLELYNSQGALVLRQDTGVYGEGFQRINLSVADLPNGMYNLRLLQANGEQSSHPVLVNR